MTAPTTTTQMAAALALIAQGHIRIIDVDCEPDSDDLAFALADIDDTQVTCYVAGRWICDCTPDAADATCEHALAMRLVLAPEGISR
ncbi:MAG: hypothetical protein M3P23_05540 [Actinomycetota bacterium]|nr:hypothetical protein [Actinomycetota bacterium]